MCLGVCSCCLEQRSAGLFNSFVFLTGCLKIHALFWTSSAEGTQADVIDSRGNLRTAVSKLVDERGARERGALHTHQPTGL